MHFYAHNLTSLHFSSLYMFCLGCKTIRRRAARRLIVLHPRQNVESELKWQKMVIFCIESICCLSIKGLNSFYHYEVLVKVACRYNLAAVTFFHRGQVQT